MRFFRKSATLVMAVFGLSLLILDSRGAIMGAQEGVQLCIRTLIPSLFPFFVISSFFCSACATARLPILKSILRFCAMPDGADALFIIGMLGGYPVGAKSIVDAYNNGQIDSENAKRMLGFCSNAGPAFVFGIVGAYFDAPYIPWLILGIQILSAILTGWLLPKTNDPQHISFKYQRVRFTDVFHGSVSAIVSVCGWVILFRVLISILKRWIFWIFPESLQIVLTGVLELSNGCLELGGISNDGMRFIVSTALLSFGGLCVYLQTISVTGSLGTGYYFPGKIIQCSIAVVLSGFMQYWLFSDENRMPLTVMIIPILLCITVLPIARMRDYKKTVAIPRKLVYNTGK